MDTFLFLILPFVLVWLLLVRPQQKRVRRQQDLLASLQVGDEVITIGGIFGTITDLDDQSVTLAVAPDVDLRILRGAISRRLDEYEDENDGDDQSDQDGQDEQDQAHDDVGLVDGDSSDDRPEHRPDDEPNRGLR